MSTEKNKQIIRRLFEEGMNQRNFSLIDEFVADSYVNHDMPGNEKGPGAFRNIIEGFVSGFPDMRIHVAEIIGDGDLVATRGEWTGTHSGNFMGIPATGKNISVKYMDMWRLENGKAAENWVQMDMPAMMQQLGVMPAPAAS